MDSLVGWNEELDALPVEKPDADEQVTLTPAVGQSIDLSAIAGFDAQFYQTGADLWIVFEDGAILVVEGYFEGASETEAGTPRSVIVDGETFTGEEFLAAFAVGDLPEEFALGDSDGPQQNATSFDDPSLPDLGPGFRGLGLLGNTDLSRPDPEFEDPTAIADDDETVDDVLALIGSTAITVDEDDMLVFGPTFLSFGNDPRDGDTDGSTTGPSDLFGPAYATGSLAGIVSFGAAGAAAGGGFGFAGDAESQMEGLGLLSKGEDLSFSIFGDSLVGYVDDGDTVYDPQADRTVLSFTLDNTTGDFVFRLFDQLDHVDDGNNDENTQLQTIGGTLDTIDFGIALEATDNGGNTVGLDDRVVVTVTDDIPAPEIFFNARPEADPGNVRVDETYGRHSDNVFRFNPNTGQFEFNPNVVAQFNGVVNPGSDPDLPGPIYARDDILSGPAFFGADEPVNRLGSRTFELVIENTASGLSTTEGAPIVLSLENGLVIGRVDADGDGVVTTADPAAFAVRIGVLGNISIAQYISLFHDDPDSSDEHIAFPVGTLSVRLTVTDADGDTASAERDISRRITFDDDGPEANLTVFDIEVDETAIDPDDPTVFISASGELDFDGGADGATVTDASIFSDSMNGDDLVTRIDLDESRPGVRGSEGDLTVGGEFVTSTSTVDANTGEITIVGVIDGTMTEVFKIVVQPDGTYTYEQYLAFDHPDIDETGINDVVTLELDFTVTDGDGDTDFSYAVIRIGDDGPTLTSIAATATVDEAGVPLIFEDPMVTGVDGFGTSVTVFENYLLVGSPRDENNGTDFGDVHLFDLTTGNLVHTFDGVNFSRGSFFGGPQFGASVDMEGNLILVGAPFDAQGGPRQGEAHLFDATTGTLIASFDAPRGGAEDQFGSDVAISGDLLLIGARGVVDGGTRGGQAYLFDANNPGNPPIVINNPTASREDQFGSFVDIDGNYLVVSAPSNGTSAGEVHLFDTAGNYILSFPDPSPNSQDRFGSDVAIQGNLVVIGARLEDTTERNSGQAYLYSFDANTGTSQLLHTFDDPEPVRDGFFGFSVAIDGNRVVIGASARDASGNETGRSYVFDATTGNLIQTLEDPTPSRFGGDDMGASVSIDGNTIAVGAPGDATQGTDVGQVYVFQAGTGSFQATLDLSALVDFGADGPATGGGFSLQTFAAQDFGTLTSGDKQVRIVSDGTTIIGFIDDGTTDPDNGTLDDDDTTVFTLTLDGTDAVFSLLKQFDHITDDPIPLDFGQFIDATDGDGDTVALTGKVTINVGDDEPVVSANAAVQLDDEAATTTNAPSNTGGNGDVDPDTANTSGTLGLSFGADGGTVAWLTSGAPNGFTYTPSGDDLLIQQVQNGVLVTVITVTLTPATGAYTVTQNLPILHADDIANAENDQAFTLAYRVTDGDGDTADGSLTINVDDDTPVVSDDMATTVAGTAVTFDALTNDSAGADGLGSVTFRTASNGTVVRNNDGTFTYTPNAGFSGSDSFTYTMTDGDGDTATATVTITVTGPPAPVNDIILHNDIVTGTLFDVPEWALLLNDTDPDGDDLDITGIKTIIDLDGATHTPGSGTNGFVRFEVGDELEGSFDYTVSDGSALADATVAVKGQDAGNVNGTDADEILLGNELNTTFDGGGGNDVIIAGAGNDTIIGGAGDDVLIGGIGRDTLTGGSDADMFVIDPSAFANAAADIITDFDSNEGDVIDLSQLLELALGVTHVSQADAEGAVKLQANGANTDIVVTNGTATETVATLHGSYTAVDILHDNTSVELSITA